MTRKCDAGEPVSAFVFKTLVDPFVGKISFLKVISGKVTPGMELYNARAERAEKLSTLFHYRGKNQGEVSVVEAGDIVVATNCNIPRRETPSAIKPVTFNIRPSNFRSPACSWRFKEKRKVTRTRSFRYTETHGRRSFLYDSEK